MSNQYKERLFVSICNGIGYGRHSKKKIAQVAKLLGPTSYMLKRDLANVIRRNRRAKAARQS